jgi:exodeoxyribonuclease VII large subunit
LIKHLRDSQQRVDFSRESLRRHARQRVNDARLVLRNFAGVVRAHNPRRELAALRRNVHDLRKRLVSLGPQALQNVRQRFQRVEGILRAVGPEATLRRGYSITTTAEGKVIRSIALVRPKMKIRTRLSDGDFASEVD